MGHVQAPLASAVSLRFFFLFRNAIFYWHQPANKKTYAALESLGSSVNENYISLLILPQMIISTNLKSQATCGSNSLAENNTYFTSRQGHIKIKDHHYQTTVNDD